MIRFNFFFLKGNYNGGRNLHRGRNVLKFESDYDFEQANSKFEELRLQLTKLKVGEEQKVQQVCELMIFFIMNVLFLHVLRFKNLLKEL